MKLRSKVIAERASDLGFRDVGRRIVFTLNGTAVDGILDHAWIRRDFKGGTEVAVKVDTPAGMTYSATLPPDYPVSVEP